VCFRTSLPESDNNEIGYVGMSQQGFFGLDGQVAVVTGGGQGIGEAIARRLRAAGSRVAILDVNEQTAESVARSIRGFSVQCDVSDRESILRAISEVRRNLGKITILVNNAGILGKTGYIWELNEADLDAVYNTNFKSVFLMCHAVIGEMLESGYGRVLNVASISGKEGIPRLIPYSSTKAAVIAFTKALAKEVAGRGDITVNSIAPAIVHTKILDTMPRETLDSLLGKIPMGRQGKVEEIAALAHYLVSPDASFTTGQCYDISGGRATY
jgi:NAD(P)-dependent dehydrogenase (short-subunit alcohol dehydrogenase family)